MRKGLLCIGRRSGVCMDSSRDRPPSNYMCSSVVCMVYCAVVDLRAVVVVSSGIRLPLAASLRIGMNI